MAGETLQVKLRRENVATPAAVVMILMIMIVERTQVILKGGLAVDNL